MNVKSVILIVAALLFAGGTAFVASRLMTTPPAPVAKAPKEEPAKKVLVAKGNLPAGTFIKEEDVSWQKWPVDGVNEHYLLEGQSDLSSVVGAVVRKGIVAGEPITEGQIARPGDRGFLAAVLTPGMRAIAIDVNEPSSVAGLIFPGDRIDILLNMAFELEDEEGGSSNYRPQTSETILQNVRLLATDRRTNDIDAEPRKANTVTIEVTPKQAEMVKVAATMGSLHMSLRGLGKPDGQPSGPTVASAEAMATSASFLAETVAGTPGDQAKPNPGQVFDEELPERGDSFTFDLEVSRPMVELMHPGGVVQIIRGSNDGEPVIQNVTPKTASK